jgi:hypothetical protein
MGLADREQEVEIESDEEQDLMGLADKEQEVEIEREEEQDLMGLADREQGRGVFVLVLGLGATPHGF